MKRAREEIDTATMGLVINNKDYRNSTWRGWTWKTIVNHRDWNSGQLCGHAKRRCGERFGMSSSEYSFVLNDLDPNDNITITWDNDLRRMKVYFESRVSGKQIVIIQNCDTYGYALPFHQWRVITCYPVVKTDADEPENEVVQLDFGFE